MLRYVAIIAAIGLARPSICAAAVELWLSSAATTATGSAFPTSPGGVPIFEPYIGGIGKVYVWGRPDAGESLINLSLNIVAETQPVCTPSCVVPGAIQFTGATMYNPQFGTTALKRFEYIDDTTGTPPLPPGTTRIDGLEGLQIFDTGAVPAVGIGNTTDSLYSSPNNSWLIAEIRYKALAAGENTETRLFLEIGPVGMNHVGETTIDTFAVFGDATDMALNAHDDRGVHPGNHDARIYPRVCRGMPIEMASSLLWPTTRFGESNFGSTTQLAADHSHNGDHRRGRLT